MGQKVVDAMTDDAVDFRYPGHTATLRAAKAALKHCRSLRAEARGADASARGVDDSVPLANDSDVHVAGTSEGRFFDGTLDFLRIAQGTLADADTTD